MTWKVTRSDGGFLPDWLTYTHETLEFFGVPPVVMALPVNMMAFNPITLEFREVNFTIYVMPNNNPKVNLDVLGRDYFHEFANSEEREFGYWFSYSVPADLFYDPKNVN